jgi:3-oxoacyl-[acyl-carrier-protein] synthase III
MIRAAVQAIAYHLPERVITNDELAFRFPEWTAMDIEDKTGIARRHIASDAECASDLAVAAAERLFAEGHCAPGDIDFLLLCTQSPDYFLPTSACLVQDRLGLPVSIGALDFNLGCSGYVYGLSLAKGLIETGQARKVLLLTADTYSKFLRPDDRSTRALFGDAAAATLVTALDSGNDGEDLGPFVFGTDGAGAANLIVEGGALRERTTTARAGQGRSRELFMNGPEIFSFTLRSVPPATVELLRRAALSIEDIDLFVFHQANEFMLEHLRRKMNIPKDRFFVGLRETGNTVSSTIPIALRNAADEGRLRPGDRVVLVGFGVGYSWGATLLRWP